MSVLAAYGKGLAIAGQLNQAAEVLSRAHTPEKPDWSVVSAQGTTADELGDHEAAPGAIWRTPMYEKGFIMAIKADQLFERTRLPLSR